MASTFPPRKSKMLHFVLVESKKSLISWSVRCITNCTIILFHGTRKTELGVLSANSGVEEIMTWVFFLKKVLNYMLFLYDSYFLGF